MNRLQLYKELRKHRHLADQRAMNFAENKAAKWLVLIISAIAVVYLIGFALVFSLIANESVKYTPMEFIFSMAPVLMSIDFFFRFFTQQTPSQLVKPYVLLPMPRYTCVDVFIASSMFNWGNLIWFVTLVPYSIMSVVFSQGIGNVLAMFVVYYLMVLANSQWYSVVRTLVNDKMLYWIIPIVAYAGIYSPFFIGENAGDAQFFSFYATAGDAISHGNLWPYLVILTALAVLVYINRRLQYKYVWRELGKTTQVTTHKVNQFAFLARYGEIGSYLQLEIKSIIRNKNPRKSFIFANVIVIILSAVITLTSVYDNNFMTNFWCIYNYFIYGAMMLVRIMCNEGNYIDCLMVRRENILTLLESKYVFYSLFLIFPFLLMLPQVFAGKWTLLMLIAYGIYTAGCQYFIIFQLAVYNSTTTPLNAKLISKNGIENNYVQVVAQMIAFIFPMILISILEAFLPKTIAYLGMLAIGLAFVLTHKLWLRIIYHRMMKKKYVLLEGFRSTR